MNRITAADPDKDSPDHAVFQVGDVFYDDAEVADRVAAAEAEYPDYTVTSEHLIDNGDETSSWVED